MGFLAGFSAGAALCAVFGSLGWLPDPFWGPPVVWFGLWGATGGLLPGLVWGARAGLALSAVEAAARERDLKRRRSSLAAACRETVRCFGDAAVAALALPVLFVLALLLAVMRLPVVLARLA